ncbi:regulatory protein RecX [Alteromonas sediminis]|uniref:Regulatory protein RecX n=1 Tax=Alteromonas sediminis TaxID=2259342 RepID=A0A3N5XWJ3_9ALTE|nr:regulatory protein RecX [Alteromonas sediminis]RPJ65032.1 regulatory protein RecX [Alteromonas sediminis]
MSDDVAKVIRHTVTRLLARREHGFWELIDKLRQKGIEEQAAIDGVMQFQEAGLQSDERFAETIVRNTAAKGQGFRRAKAHLSSLKVDDGIISQGYNEADIDWYAVALAAKQKKFGIETATDLQQKAKQQRFLAYRGFSQEEINHAMTYRD